MLAWGCVANKSWYELVSEEDLFVVKSFSTIVKNLYSLSLSGRNETKILICDQRSEMMQIYYVLKDSV